MAYFGHHDLTRIYVFKLNEYFDKLLNVKNVKIFMIKVLDYIILI